MKQTICIITGSGNGLGSGHLQRMMNLSRFIRKHTPHDSRICISGQVAGIPTEMRSFFTDSLPPCSLIIRDMRDSTAEEIIDLRRTAPVISIDDCGPGRGLADLSVDLLPNPLNAAPRDDLFLFGHTFTESIRAMRSERIVKEIDVALYCGFRTGTEAARALLSLVPDELSCAVLAGSDSRLVTRGESTPLSLSCAATLFASKVLVSHFGITLYEGHLAGCRLVSVNPTDYHSRLTDMAAPRLAIVNLGLLYRTDTAAAAAALLDMSRIPPADPTDPAGALGLIERNLHNFYTSIAPFMTGV